MLELVGLRGAFDAFYHRHRPVVPANSAYHRAQGAPVIQRCRRVRKANVACCTPLFREVETVARRAPGKTGSQRRWTTLEVGARTANGIRIDDHTRVAERDMLIARRGLDGLVVDASVGHGHAEADEGVDRAPLQAQHRRRVAQEGCFREVGAAGIRDGRDTNPRLPVAGGRCKVLEPAYAGLAEAFRIRHDVGLRDPDEVFGAEELTHLELVLQRLLAHPAAGPGENLALFFSQFHRSTRAPDMRTASRHFASSATWKSTNARPVRAAGRPPSGSSLARRVSPRTMRSTSPARLLARSVGSFAGAKIAHQAVVSKSG